MLLVLNNYKQTENALTCFWPTFHAFSACLDLIRPDFELYATKQQRKQAFRPELSGA